MVGLAYFHVNLGTIPEDNQAWLFGSVEHWWFVEEILRHLPFECNETARGSLKEVELVGYRWTLSMTCKWVYLQPKLIMLPK